ncbi:MAG: hypothetical protein ABS69_04960 [Nitrosomonadales bacterium SCN 54-20]|nr:MAG: hypothetical protein ABS69_04960 [Nitrosomonadales bacterium SCN 54-20]
MASMRFKPDTTISVYCPIPWVTALDNSNTEGEWRKKPPFTMSMYVLFMTPMAMEEKHIVAPQHVPPAG